MQQQNRLEDFLIQQSQKQKSVKYETEEPAMHAKGAI